MSSPSSHSIPHSFPDPDPAHLPFSLSDVMSFPPNSSLSGPVSIDSLSPDALTKLISHYEHRAEFEEREGCFAVAEVFLKKAAQIAASDFPVSKSASRINSNLALFYSKFLPKAEISIVYLRKSIDIEQRLDPASTAIADLSLRLGTALVEANYLEEATTIQDTVAHMSISSEIHTKAKLLAVRIQMSLRDFLSAEAILNEVITYGDVWDPELRGEAYSLLGEVLNEKEEYSKSDTVLEEAIRLLKITVKEPFFHTLSFYSQECVKRNRFATVDSVFKALLAELESRSAPLYFLAKVITIWGEAYDFVSNETCARLYLQALQIYQSVKSESCYVAVVLQKLLQIYDPNSTFWSEKVLETADLQLSAVLNSLPTVLSLLAIGFTTVDSSESVAREKFTDMVLALNDGEGEVLAQLSSNLDFVEVNEERMQQWATGNPNCGLAAILLRRLSSRDLAVETYSNIGASPALIADIIIETDSHSLPRAILPRTTDETYDFSTDWWLNRLDFSTFRIPSSETVIKQLEKAVNLCSAVSFDAARKMQQLANVYEAVGRTELAEEMLQRAVEQTKAVNPTSFSTVKSLFFLSLFYARRQNDQKSLSNLLESLEIGLKSCPAKVDFVVKLLHSYYLTAGAHQKAADLLRQFDESLCSEVEMSQQMFDNLILVPGPCIYSERILKRMIVFAEGTDSTRSGFADLALKLQWFTGTESEEFTKSWGVKNALFNVYQALGNLFWAQRKRGDEGRNDIRNLLGFPDKYKREEISEEAIHTLRDCYSEEKADLRTIFSKKTSDS